MGRGYCACGGRQRADGTCGTPECSHYRQAKKGKDYANFVKKRQAKAQLRQSPFLGRVARRRLSKKSKASSLIRQAAQGQAQEPSLQAAQQEAQEVVFQAGQDEGRAEPQASQAEQSSPQAPTRSRLSLRQKTKIVQILWEQLDVVRGRLGPDLACHMVGAAIRAVELISQELPKVPERQLAESFLNVGAALAGGQLQTELNIVRDLHPGSMDIEYDIRQAMQPFQF